MQKYRFFLILRRPLLIEESDGGKGEYFVLEISN
jgi:hypothetical protein